MSDYSAVIPTVKYGLINSTNDNIVQNRVLVPYLAHLIFKLVSPLGTWNMTSFSMLFIGSMFTSFSSVAIFEFIYRETKNIVIAFAAIILFLTNFFTINFHLVNSVDSALCFFCILFILTFYKRQFMFIVPIVVFGCLSKEVFLPVSASICCGSIAYVFFKERKLDWNLVALSITSILVGLLTLIILFYLTNGKIFSPLNELNRISGNNSDYVWSFSTIISDTMRIALFFGPLTVLSVFSILKVHRELLFHLIFLGCTTTALGLYIGVAGLDYVRFIFNSGAVVLVYSASITLNRVLVWKSSI